MTTGATIWSSIIALAAFALYFDFQRHRSRFNRLRRRLLSAGMIVPAVTMALLTVFQSAMPRADVIARLAALGILGALGIRVALDPYLREQSSGTDT